MIWTLLAAAVLHQPVHELKAFDHRGKPLGVYEAPTHQARLIYASGSTGGDFPETPIYVQAGTHVYDLGTYRGLTKVTWAKDGKSVTFEATKLKDYGVDDVLRITYRLGAKTLDRQVLRQQKDEPTG